MRNKQFIFFFLITISFYSKGQENNNWYFGRRASVQFNGSSNSPAVLNDSQMIADESAASISDAAGNLLFYTNGNIVYNRKNQVMLNGEDLAGNISASQTLIVPIPGNDSLYYIFTTDAIENNFAAGYNYSLVNMKSDTGYGEVISKNLPLTASCTERMAAIRHANGIDVWLITNDNSSDIFRAWLITCFGIQLTPVVSLSGVIMSQDPIMSTGVLRGSNDGKQICQTHFPSFDDITNPPNFLQLFDFDNATGILSNARKIEFSDAQYSHAEFSPDAKLLYITRGDIKAIDQLEVKLPSIAGILASRISLPTENIYFDIKLGVDEKIYLARPGFNLAKISQPNSKGLGSGIIENAVNLNPRSAYLGLPSSINDIVANPDTVHGFNYTILDSCSGIVRFSVNTTMPGAINWFWDFGDGNTSTLQNPVHQFSPTNIEYTVIVKMYSSLSCGVSKRTRMIKPSGITGTLNFEFTVRCDSGYIKFTNTSDNLNASGVQYQWDFGDGSFSTNPSPIHSYTNPGNYTVKLKKITGIPCLDDSITKSVSFISYSITASPDQTIRIGEQVVLSYSGISGNPEWQPANWLNNNLSKSPIATPLEDIQYKIVVTNSDGCKAEDSVLIKVIQYDDIYIPSAFTPNNDGLNDFFRPFYPGTILLNSFNLFNRRGRKVFSTNKRGNGWDGRLNNELQPPGVYVWTFEATDEKTKKEINKKGTVVLIR